MKPEDLIGLISSSCPLCHSRNNLYDSIFDFRVCNECGEVWSDGANDPDYDEELSLADYDPDYGDSCSL